MSGPGRSAGGTQRERFLGGEGDAWLARNRGDPAELERRAQSDPVLRALRQLRGAAKSVLEVGASDGWRLHALRGEGLATHAYGLDPSKRASAEGRDRFDVDGVRGTAERLPFASRRFDLVILGFFLYLCDRDDLFAIVAEVDRVIAREGRLAILDFHASPAERRRYSHAEGVFSYKMDYSELFLCNPAYQLLYREIGPYPDPVQAAASDGRDQCMVAVLQRDPAGAYRDAEGPRP